MSKLYALFKNEDNAQSAADKITSYDKDIKLSFFDSNLSNAEDDILISEIQIIGSPSGMLANSTASGNLNSATTGSQPEFSPFCYADFGVTAKNSLSSPVPHKNYLPSEGFEAGLSLNIPFSKKDAVIKILEDEGANII